MTSRYAGKGARCTAAFCDLLRLRKGTALLGKVSLGAAGLNSTKARLNLQTAPCGGRNLKGEKKPAGSVKKEGAILQVLDMGKVQKRVQVVENWVHPVRNLLRPHSLQISKS